MQDLMDTFSTACSELGLMISLEKITTLYQAAPDKFLAQIKLYVYSQKLHVVYLDNTVNRTNTLDDAICLQIKKVTNAFRKLDRHL